MFGPAAVCRYFGENILTPLYRDQFSSTLIKNATVQDQHITGLGKPIALSRIPQLGHITFLNESQFVYNLGGRYEVRELTPFGKTLHKTSQDIGSIDDGIGWISLVGLIVIIAAVIFFPAVKTTATLFQWASLFVGSLAALTGLAYQRRALLNQPS